jgi:sensor c-di-GMP phosphodiesterase-like protein
MELSMKEIEDMIDLSKKLFKHIYMNITSSDLIDSELIAAAAKMLESIHINIAEFI